MPLKLSQEAKDALAAQFKQWVTEVEDDRRDRMHEVYTNALRNYEGKEPVKNLPWPGASNAVLPITATHSDAIAARLYNAATAHDPIFLIRSHGSGEFIPGVSNEEYARWWQNISKWIEQTQIDYKDIEEENIQTFVLFGDSFLYPIWERKETLFPVIRGDKEELEPEITVNKPSISVIHPKDFFMRSFDKDPQEAEMCGFLYDISLLGIEEKIRSKEWDKEQAEKLLGRYREKEDKKSSVERKAKKGHYHPIGGEYMNADEYEEKMKSLLGIQPTENTGLVKMVRLYWRVDFDNKGLPAEYVVDIDKEDGIIVRIDYNRHFHKERPIIHYRYSRRAGTWMSRGVPELLFNIQKIMNVTMRDILDNNKIRNTQIFLMKKGGDIGKQLRLFPGKQIFVDNPQGNEIQAIPMGTGSSNTQVEDISVMERWGQLITGITDFNLGQEKRSRTPAATTLALIEQGNQRLERPIDTMRKSMEKTHWQVLQLFLQHWQDLDQLAQIADAKDPNLFKEAWIATTPKVFKEKIKISPEVSSNAFNRQSQRQESLALSGYVEQLYQKVAFLAQQIGQAQQGTPAQQDPKTGQVMPGTPPNPTMVALLTLMAKGLHRMATRVLDTFDIKDQEPLNPELLSILPGMMQNAANTNIQDPNGSGPVETAQSVVSLGASQAQPAEAPGRPQSGQPRTPGRGPGQPG